jgi:hypothetical protein
VSNKTSGILWSAGGLVFGLITLIGLGGGGYWAYHTHTVVQEFQSGVDKDKDELDALKKRPFLNPIQSEKLDRRINEGEVNVQNAQRDRMIAVIVACSATIIPGVMALALLGMGVVRFLQKPKKKKADEDEKDEEDEEEEEAEEPPARKAKAKRTDD